MSASLYQVVGFAVRTLSMVILARLLTPRDYGVFAMALTVVAVAGVLREGGLSDAAVQSGEITPQQQSTLFWINVLLGCGFAGLCAASAGVMATFYREPSLFAVMTVLGTTFVFTGLSVQHRAVLLRQLRVTAVGGLDLASQVFGLGAAIAMAWAGYGCWALVASYLLPSVVAVPFLYMLTRWLPGAPASWAKTRHLISYGSTVTVNSLVMYFAANAEKVLLGRFWGAEPVGIYTRAYQLSGIPSGAFDAIGASVVFPAFARVRSDPVRLRRYFLEVYSLWVSAALPVAAATALFADDIVALTLGSQWTSGAPVLRLLAPVIVASALTRPFLWLLFADGRVARNLKISIATVPVMLSAYLLGISGGPPNVATAYSVASVLVVVPVAISSKRGTSITAVDLLWSVALPFAALLGATVVTLAAHPVVARPASPLWRLSAGFGLLCATYVVLLLLSPSHRSAIFQHLARTGFISARPSVAESR